MSTQAPTTNIATTLTKLIASAEEQGFEQVSNDLTNLYQYCADRMEEDSTCFLATLLLSTYIAKNSGSAGTDNIYLKNYEVSQIQLFDILIDKLPYVKYSQAITNRQMVQLLSGMEEATLLDIGIGLGTQVRNILAQCKGMTGLKRLVVVGIEPGAEALAVAQSSIMAMQADMPFAIEFVGYHGFAEDMDLASLAYRTNNIIVNASLALHHIQSGEKRDRVLAQVKALQPAGFFLIEPNSDHFKTDFLKRFSNCFRHFYSLFKTIDTLDISGREKSALKLFFGREIEDIIGKPEEMRFEKHETATAWIERLKRQDYEMKSHLLQSPVSYESGVEIGFQPEGYLGFSYENDTVLSVIYAA